MHFRHVPLRTIIIWPHSEHGSPSKPACFANVRRALTDVMSVVAT